MKPSQCQAILDELLKTPGQWVPMPQLVVVSGAYAVHSRVSELRDRGHHIEARVEIGRPSKSFYRITTAEPRTQDIS